MSIFMSDSASSAEHGFEQPYVQDTSEVFVELELMLASGGIEVLSKMELVAHSISVRGTEDNSVGALLSLRPSSSVFT